MREEYKELISSAKRIVVKIGTSSLTHETGNLDLEMIEKICRQLANIHFSGKEVLLVSSGAVGAGLSKLGYLERPKTIPEKQAAAAVGQGILMHAYEKIFAEYGVIVAQLLLTRDDLRNRKRFLNSRNTLHTLLEKRVIPIINENDTVVVEEIKFGDNDTLAALVASLIDADLLILLTDIDGLYTADPRKDANAQLISVIPEINEDIMGLAGQSGSKFASGGMITKIGAGKIAVNSGIPMIIAKSRQENILNRLVSGENLGSLFLPQEANSHARKKWIEFFSEIEGVLTVDQGCKDALLCKTKSLLAKGLLKVEGEFSKGSIISITDEDGEEFARGIASYSSLDMEKVKGRHSEEFLDILGYSDSDCLVHCDNLIVRE